MAVRWHSLPEHFTAKKKTLQLIFPTGKKIAEEETGLEPDRVHARHLHLRHTP